jgi:hypothetical protein
VYKQAQGENGREDESKLLEHVVKSMFAGAAYTQTVLQTLLKAVQKTTKSTQKIPCVLVMRTVENMASSQRNIVLVYGHTSLHIYMRYNLPHDFGGMVQNRSYIQGELKLGHVGTFRKT